MEDRVLGLDYKYIMEKLNLKPGDKIVINYYRDNGMLEGKLHGTVIRVYPTYVLMDMVCYKECRMLADIFINKRSSYRIIRVHAN